MRVYSPRFHSVLKWNSTQIAASQGVSTSVNNGTVPRGRLISRAFLRVRSDLVVGSATAKLAVGTALQRAALMTALVSSLQITTAAAHPIQTQICEQMALGDLGLMQADIGIYPLCPQLYGDGQYSGQILAEKRSAVTPAALTQSHFVSLEIPLIDQRVRGAGTSLYLPPDALDGTTFTFTMGAFTFVDGNGTTITIPNGSGAATGVTSIELVIESVPNPSGSPRVAFPLVFKKTPNGTTSQMVLNPSGGAIAAAKVRIPSIGNDSLAYLVRTYAFTSTSSLDEAEEAAFTPQLRVDGNLPSDLVNRGLECYAGLDLIAADAAAVATSHGLRATDDATAAGAGAYVPGSTYYDPGTRLVWNASAANFFEGLSFGRHEVIFPGAWTSIGNRDIYTVLVPDVGAQGNPVVSPAAQAASGRATRGVLARLAAVFGRST